MSEISDALRQYADRMDRDQNFQATGCALALTDATGKMQANYIGRDQPAAAALTHLLARGIEQVVVSQLKGAMTVSSGSTA